MSDLIIRPLRSDDALQWHWQRTAPNVMWGTLQYPTINVEEIRGQLAAPPGNYVLGVEMDGKLVASAGIHGPGPGRRQHAAGLGMSVHDDYQGRGIGKALMNALLDLADNWVMLERIMLDVYTDNHRAIALYESVGFVAEGVARGGAFRDGAYVDLLHMGRLRGRAAGAGPTAVPAPRPRTAPVAAAAAPVTLRVARPEDARQLHALFRHPGIWPGMGRTPTQQEDDVRKELGALARNHHYVVAEAAGAVVGAAYMVQMPAGRMVHAGTIRFVAVHPDWQGQGVGAALLGALVDVADRWLQIKRLTAEVPALCPEPLALFARLGFEREAVFRGALAYGGALSDTWLLARSL